MTKLPNLELLMYKAGIYLDYDEEFAQKAKGNHYISQSRHSPKHGVVHVQGSTLQRTEKLL